MAIIIVIIILLFIGYLFLKSPNRIIKPNYVNVFIGSLGSGKTLTATNLAKRVYKSIPKKERKNVNVWANFLFIYDLKNFKIAKRFDSKEEVIDLSRYGEKDIIIIDEVSDIFPSKAQKSDPDLIRFIRDYRHQTDGTLIFTDQSIGSIDIEIRRKLTTLYLLADLTKKMFGRFYSLRIDKIKFQEDTNISMVGKLGEKFKNNTFAMFPKRCYNDRYRKRDKWQFEKKEGDIV